jgi:hypothetical protein
MTVLRESELLAHVASARLRRHRDVLMSIAPNYLIGRAHTRALDERRARSPKYWLKQQHAGLLSDKRASREYQERGERAASDEDPPHIERGSPPLFDCSSCPSRTPTLGPYLDKRET